MLSNDNYITSINIYTVSLILLEILQYLLNASFQRTFPPETATFPLASTTKQTEPLIDGWSSADSDKQTKCNRAPTPTPKNFYWQE